MNTDNTSSAIEPNPDVVPEDMRDPSEDRWMSMPVWVRALVLVASAGGVLMAIGYIFSIFPLLDLTYYFLLMAAFLPVVYLLLPAWKGEKGVTWASYAPAIAIAVLCLIMAYFARQLVFGTWVPVREDWQLVVAVGLYLLILEGARRSGGVVFLVIVLVLSLYPVYAFYMPGIFWGPPTSFARTVAFNVFSNDAMLGVVTRVVAETLIGFLLLAALMVATGAAEFFLNLALAMMGTARGGPAKVSVLASGFFGSLSGSIFSNVVGTGSVTIPAMKKAGAAGVQAARLRSEAGRIADRLQGSSRIGRPYHGPPTRYTP